MRVSGLKLAYLPRNWSSTCTDSHPGVAQLGHTSRLRDVETEAQDSPLSFIPKTLSGYDLNLSECLFSSIGPFDKQIQLLKQINRLKLHHSILK